MIRDNRGVILVTVLWVVLILSLIAWGLSRRSSLEVSLLETYQGKLRSYAAACAGVNSVLDLMQRQPSTKQTPESIFSKNFGTDTKGRLVYGLQDEQGKINVNAINLNNYQVLSALFQLKGLSQAQADTLALAVVSFAQPSPGNNRWLTSDSSQPAVLKPKGKPYEHLLELLEVNGMTQAIFDQIKDDVTVWGDTQNGFWVNGDTANNEVIQAIANAAARGDPSMNAGDIIRREGKSAYFRARVVGVDASTGVRTVVQAVIHHTQGSAGEIIAWQRD